MADFSALKTSIQNYIKQNGNNEITGAILQQILLSMVTALGDNAINDLVTALGDEVSARQNADTTLQGSIDDEATARQNADNTLQYNIGAEATARSNADNALGTRIDNEKTAREDADNALGTRIENEATARGNADTALQNAINTINTKLAEGYVYVGIATTSSNPSTPSGKVFYIATAAGIYTHFGSLTVTQGINILKYNGSTWSVEQVLGVDDNPTDGSNNLIKSDGVYAQGVIKNAETNLAFYVGFLWASSGSYSNTGDYRISKAYEIDKLDYIEGLVGTAGVATIAFLKYGQPLVQDTFLGAYVSTGTQQNPQTIKKSELTIPEGTRFFALSWDTTKISSPTIHFKSTIKDNVVNLNKETTIVKEFKINESFVNAHYWNGATEKFVSSINSGWRTTDLYNLDYFDKVEAIMPKAAIGATLSNGVVFDKDFLPKRYLYFSGIGTNTIVDICVKKEAEDEKFVMFQAHTNDQTDACKLITYHTIDKESFGEPAMSYFLKNEIFTEPRTQAPARLIASKTLNDKSKDEFLVIFCAGNGATLSDSYGITETTAAYFAEHHISYATIMYQGTIYGADNRAWGNNVAYNAIVDFYTYLMEKYPFRRDVILMGGSMGGLTMGQLAYKRPFPIRFCFGIGIAPGLDICWEYSGINFPAVRAAMRAAFGLASDGSEDENFDIVSQGYDWRPMGVIGDETKQKVGFPNFYIYYGTDDVTRALFGGVENWETLKQWFINAGVKSVTKNLGEVGHAPMSAIDTAISDGVFDEELSFYVEPAE